MYCQDHVPVPVYAAQPGAGPGTVPPNPYVQPVVAPVSPMSPSPLAAFLLGWIPGVGAIYNGQYIKGLIHAVIFGLIISLMNTADGAPSEPFLAMVLVGFIFYMPFEAYHTAKRRQVGLPVDEWSSLTGNNRFTSRVPIGPIILIGIGVLFLLDTLHLLEFREIARFWPVLLIVIGVSMLYGRMTGLRSHMSDQGYSARTRANAANDEALGVSREQ